MKVTTSTLACCIHQLISMCQRVGFQLHIAYETTLPQTQIGLVAAGIGVTLTFALMANLQRPSVVYKPLREPTLELAAVVAWTTGDASGADAIKRVGPVHFCGLMQ